MSSRSSASSFITAKNRTSVMLCLVPALHAPCQNTFPEPFVPQYSDIDRLYRVRPAHCKLCFTSIAL